MPNVGTYEYKVQLRGRESWVRARTASEAKRSMAEKVLAGSGQPYTDDHVRSLANEANAKRTQKITGFKAW